MATADPIPITAAGRAALQRELDELVTERRPEVVRRISTTRDEGDLKENAGYHQAREDQGRIEGRIAELEELLRRAVIIAEGSADGHVSVGSTVKVTDEFGESTYQLVGAPEVDPAAGKISADSPVGRALVGRVAGDVVTVDTPSGPRQLTIVRVE